MQKLGFNHWAVPVEFVVHELALWQVSLLVFPFPPVSITPPMLHIHLHLHAALNRRTNGQSLGTSRKAMQFSRSNCLKSDFKALIFAVLIRYHDFHTWSAIWTRLIWYYRVTMTLQLLSCQNTRDNLYPEDRGGYVRPQGVYLPNYTVSYPRRRHR